MRRSAWQVPAKRNTDCRLSETHRKNILDSGGTLILSCGEELMEEGPC